MQLPEAPPPPLASLWDRILRARALPPDLDVQLLYIAIRDRLTHPEWEVRLHALRVLADLLPISGNALAFPFDQVVDNLGHNSPNVRKAALDALKVFSSHCEEPECAARAIADKCAYQNIRPHSADVDAKANILTGLILSVPSVFGILKRRNPKLDIYSMFVILGDKLFDPFHRDVALRSLMKLRRVCGPRDYVMYFRQLDPKVQEKFRSLCEIYDEDSHDVYYAPRTVFRKSSTTSLVTKPNFISSKATTPIIVSTDSSSEDSFKHMQFYRNNFGKVIIETELKFDSDTAITMTVLEENETEAESDRNVGSEDDCDSSDQNMLKYSDGDASEDTDVVVKKVRFGGESIKIRTPDSENQVTSEDDNKSGTNEKEDNIIEVTATVTPGIVNKMIELKSENVESESASSKAKRSGIPLPVIEPKSRSKLHSVPLPKQSKIIKQKSKSLNELYDFFRNKNEDERPVEKDESGFALTLTEVRSPEKVPSPVQPHREVEVLHNLQRSPVVSPRRRRPTRFIQLENEGMVVSVSHNEEPSLLSPRDASLRPYYEWEDTGIVPRHIVDQLHNQENWISAVKAADYLHSALLEAENIRKVEPAALSLVQHMWALSEAVTATKAPAEGAVCALFRSVSSDAARGLLPALVARLARQPPPAALPHALLQRLALHHLVDLIFDPRVIGVGDPDRRQAAQLRATLCLARAAGPAAVLSAVRRRLAGTARADNFCQKEFPTAGASAASRSLDAPAGDPGAAAQAAPAARLGSPARYFPTKEGHPEDVVTNSIQRPGRPVACGGVHYAYRVEGTGAGFVKLGSYRRDVMWSPPRRLTRDGAAAASGMLALWCCGRAGVTPAPPPAPPLAPDLVADLPALTRDSSATTSSLDNEKKHAPDDELSFKSVIGETTEIDGAQEVDEDVAPPPPPPRSPSIRIEDYSDKTVPTPRSSPGRPSRDSLALHDAETKVFGDGESYFVSQTSFDVDSINSPSRSSPLRRSPPSRRSPSPAPSPDRSSSASPAGSRAPTPAAQSEPYCPAAAAAAAAGAGAGRDVRRALAECSAPARPEDWEVAVGRLQEIERLAGDAAARAPAAAWRAAARAGGAHVRSLRSRVARAACRSLGALFEHRGRALDPELEDAAAALLERCADVNRFLRADATEALARLARGAARGARRRRWRGAGRGTARGQCARRRRWRWRSWWSGTRRRACWRCPPSPAPRCSAPRGRCWGTRARRRGRRRGGCARCWRWTPASCRC
ncbi:unnamed protein product [Plutella xylostella]|uniref:(diamondback moth) hypothetical protein n=1 Tax=Plutella xylostella TaxID=51655 RepID=A0A8S4EDH6_PLUXY|nr:unnamed protein product [Plutella xylostella]